MDVYLHILISQLYYCIRLRHENTDGRGKSALVAQCLPWQLRIFVAIAQCTPPKWTHRIRRGWDAVKLHITLLSPCKHHEQPQRSHCDLFAHTRRSCGFLGDHTALLWRPYGDPSALLLQRRATAFVLCSKCAASLCVLRDPVASGGDATSLLRQCLRLYCAHVGVFLFFLFFLDIMRSTWERDPSVTGV